ncbi:MAG TPA: glycosyltransferase, partial [Asticcacaulis sp.]|nr:glycosyltransferase [Asticcacaulis sp.]
MIELSAEPDAPAHVRLQSGTYTPKLFAGVRPGHYSLTQARLRPLGVLQSAGLLGGRLIQALQGGTSLSRIMAQAMQAFKPKATFGLRARANPGPSRLGVLTRQDLQRKETDTCAIAGGPIFLIAGDRPDNQTYDRYTLDPEMPHDFIVTLTDGDRLTPDALQRMAEALAQRPETDVLIVDKWINGQPTTHIAFDPLLYSDGYPTPHVIRRGYVPTGAWRDQQTRHAVLSVPVATGLSAPVHPITVTPPDIRPPVSIIIPTRDRADLLKACLAGLFDATLWPHEVIIVDNGSVEPAALDLFASYTEKGLRVVRADIPFNFSSLCNLGAAAARHD